MNKYFLDFGDGVFVKSMKVSLDGVFYDSIKFDFDIDSSELVIVLVDKDGER